MRFITALMIGWLVLAFIMFPIAALAETGDTQTHQNKNEIGIITISQGNIKTSQNSNQGRTKLALGEGSLKTNREVEVENSNNKRLEHYQSHLDNYTPPQGELPILVTGYSSTPDQTWGNPFITASGTHVHKGMIACPAQYPFGTKIKVKSIGTFVCEDRGGKISGNHFDMWFESRIEALNWGKRIVIAEIIK